MNIGVAAPLNPKYFEKYLKKTKITIVEANVTANSVNRLVESYILNGHFVRVFTLTTDFNSYKLEGDKLEIFVIGGGFFSGAGKDRLNRYYSNIRYSFFYPNKLINLLSKSICDLDVLHAHWTYDYAFAASKFTRQVPIVCTVRDWAPYIFRVSNIKQKILFLKKLRMANNLIKNPNIYFVANSLYTEKLIQSVRSDLSIPVIYNSIQDSIVIDNRLKKDSNEIKIVSISSVLHDKRKNIECLLYAFKSLLFDYPKAQLFLIGDIDTFNYRSWKNKSLLDQVQFLGRLNQEKIIDVLDDCTMMVHPSLEETFGNILLEAMARRVPVIGGILSGAVPQVLNFGKCGLLCDVNKKEEIVKSMKYLLTNTDKIEDIVNNATLFLKSSYVSSVVTVKYIKLFSRIIKDYKNERTNS